MTGDETHASKGIEGVKTVQKIVKKTGRSCTPLDGQFASVNA